MMPRFVAAYLDRFYDDDAAVVADEGLQGWYHRLAELLPNRNVFWERVFEFILANEKKIEIADPITGKRSRLITDLDYVQDAIMVGKDVYYAGGLSKSTSISSPINLTGFIKIFVGVLFAAISPPRDPNQSPTL